MQEEKEKIEKTSEIVENRYTDPISGKFVEGNPGGGRPKETEEQKAKKKALKELIEEYKSNLTESLPKISPALIEKAQGGDIQAIKEINEVLGMHKNIVVGGDEDDPAIKVVQTLYGKRDNNTTPIHPERLPASIPSGDTESKV